MTYPTFERAADLALTVATVLGGLMMWRDQPWATMAAWSVLFAASSTLLLFHHANAFSTGSDHTGRTADQPHDHTK